MESHMGQRTAAPESAVTEGSVPLETARAKLGDLVLRAGMHGERIVISYNGKPAAALIGLADLAKLEST
jgi:prevent-host-death family protein